jgi:hypothetical protein
MRKDGKATEISLKSDRIIEIFSTSYGLSDHQIPSSPNPQIYPTHEHFFEIERKSAYSIHTKSSRVDVSFPSFL